MEDIQIIWLVIGAFIAFVTVLVARKVSLYRAYIELLTRIADDRITARLRKLWQQASEDKRRVIVSLLSNGVLLSKYTDGIEDDNLWRELEREIIG